jgi:hypothetical protein
LINHVIFDSKLGQFDAFKIMFPLLFNKSPLRRIESCNVFLRNIGITNPYISHVLKNQLTRNL